MKLVAQRGDGSLEVALRRSILPLEGGGAILEELLLPEVELGRGKLVFIAEIRNGYAVDHMTSQNSRFLNKRVVLSGLSWAAPKKLVQPKWESPGRVSLGGTHEKAKEHRRGRAITTRSRPRSGQRTHDI